MNVCLFLVEGTEIFEHLGELIGEFMLENLIHIFEIIQKVTKKPDCPIALKLRI